MTTDTPAGARRGSPWLPYGPPDPGDRTLFCLANAGAGAASYAGWRALAPDGVRVCPLQPPGRAERFAEPPHAGAPALVDALLDAIGDVFTGDYALFGHSMGAVVAFELARRLQAEGRTPPAHVFVSGRAAPYLPEPNRPIHDLPLDALIDELRVIGGTPEEILAEPELMARLQVLLRADFAVNETYRCRADEPIDAPLTVFGGDRDPRAPVASLHAWRPLTTGPFEVRVHPGGHFYLNDRPAELLALMGRFARR
ncbi:thioesterase II family protein [Streptantibioticus cattleyicolor]|uniref:Microcystin synthetase associated thioesterase n=1 Tax=Streptantibioticus cattleyicolor (strain ATCC 35852 / DSM 46488 / JCM 4925 / NBRC 14057 / NRRL 8057) TaxID=1003195 RepID=F8JL10_STREN|nr:alpha/beta fold hydrolase [Streptantibioticus cattleyicolor]AEW99631.1 microcystin synthetase associated thioesterase [Streptantibioticus cattleyicolor NRRL 8057 = DSM 46488]CCB71332.1 Gramicidin S biosynthesis protein grsT [Streptantibioticus cattleyicolor NRRL 8057 = DSM 46488]